MSKINTYPDNATRRNQSVKLEQVGQFHHAVVTYSREKLMNGEWVKITTVSESKSIKVGEDIARKLIESNWK